MHLHLHPTVRELRGDMRGEDQRVDVTPVPFPGLQQQQPVAEENVQRLVQRGGSG